MSTVMSVCSAICVVAIGGALISIIIPDGNTKKILSLVIGAFLLCSMILPVKNAISDMNFEIDGFPKETQITASADEAYTESVIKETENTLAKTLDGLLKSENINVKRIRFYLKEDENLGIIINRISIYIDKKNNSKVFRINEITEENFGQTPFVIAE